MTQQGEFEAWSKTPPKGIGVNRWGYIVRTLPPPSEFQRQYYTYAPGEVQRRLGLTAGDFRAIRDFLGLPLKRKSTRLVAVPDPRPIEEPQPDIGAILAWLQSDAFIDRIAARVAAALEARNG